MADSDRIALLKKAIRNLKQDMDSSLSDREKEALKDLIVKGQVQSEADLRGYLHRMTQARKRQDAREEESREKRKALQEKQKAEAEGRTTDSKKGDSNKDDSNKKDPSADPAKLTGKVVCAKSRSPLQYVKVRVQGKSFNVETEGPGVFIWEDMPRMDTLQFEFSLKGYKPLTYQYKSTLDNDQFIVAKMVPIESKQKQKRKIEF